MSSAAVVIGALKVDFELTNNIKPMLLWTFLIHPQCAIPFLQARHFKVQASKHLSGSQGEILFFESKSHFGRASRSCEAYKGKYVPICNNDS